VLRSLRQCRVVPGGQGASPAADIGGTILYLLARQAGWVVSDAGVSSRRSWPRSGGGIRGYAPHRRSRATCAALGSARVPSLAGLPWSACQWLRTRHSPGSGEASHQTEEIVDVPRPVTAEGDCGRAEMRFRS